MKTMLPNEYRLVMDEFDDIKLTLLIDEKQKYFSNLLGRDVLFSQDTVEQVRSMLADGLEPMIEYKDEKFVVTAIEL